MQNIEYVIIDYDDSLPPQKVSDNNLIIKTTHPTRPDRLETEINPPQEVKVHRIEDVQTPEKISVTGNNYADKKEGGSNAQAIVESGTAVPDNNNDIQDDEIPINSSNSCESGNDDISEENQAPILTPSKGGSDIESDRNDLDVELTDKDQVPATQPIVSRGKTLNRKRIVESEEEDESSPTSSDSEAAQDDNSSEESSNEEDSSDPDPKPSPKSIELAKKRIQKRKSKKAGNTKISEGTISSGNSKKVNEANLIATSQKTMAGLVEKQKSTSQEKMM